MSKMEEDEQISVEFQKELIFLKNNTIYKKQFNMIRKIR